MAPPATGRLSSNKENAVVCSPRRSTKPRVQGLGHRPVHKPKSNNIKIRTLGRKPSFIKAKRVASAISLPSVAECPSSTERAVRNASTRGAFPRVIVLLKPGTANVSTELILAIPGMSVAMPIHLPRPNDGGFSHCKVGNVSLPAAYVRNRLQAYLHRLFIVSTLYHAAPSVQSPTGTSASHRKTFAFGIPKLIKGEVVPQLSSFVAGYEPDACLALRISRPTGDSDSYRLIPITHAVYASQCKHFPAFRVSSLSKASGAILPNNEGSPPSPMSVDSSPSDGYDSDASSSTEVSSIVYHDVGPYLHLPVLALQVPDPKSFEVVHTRLHIGVKWQASLLMIKPSLLTSPAAAHSLLSGLSTFELNNRLRFMHGVWQNMYALGVQSDDMWKELTSAWAIVIQVLMQRAAAEPRWMGPTTFDGRRA